MRTIKEIDTVEVNGVWVPRRVKEIVVDAGKAYRPDKRNITKKKKLDATFRNKMKQKTCSALDQNTPLGQFLKGFMTIGKFFQ